MRGRPLCHPTPIRDAACSPSHGPRRAAGFGLLEVIVALVLLSSTGLALFTWINQNLNAANRLRQTLQASQVSINAQALVSEVNPAVQPSGKRELGALSVEWVSEVVQPLQANQSFTFGAAGSWRVGLYRLKVTAVDRTRGVTTAFEVLQTGHIAVVGALDAP